MFSNKTKAADAKWKIETFKQGKKNIVDFMIKFDALAMKADTDKCYGTLWTLTFFFFFYLFFLILYFFSFEFLFLFLLVIIKRHMILQSHDMSHDVMS